MEDNNYCHYSDLPSPMAYVEVQKIKSELSKVEVDRIIEMAWEDRTVPFQTKVY
jgi:hypothetical protein